MPTSVWKGVVLSTTVPTGRPSAALQMLPFSCKRPVHQVAAQTGVQAGRQAGKNRQSNGRAVVMYSHI